MERHIFVLELLKSKYISSSTTGISTFRILVLFFYQILQKTDRKTKAVITTRKLYNQFNMHISLLSVNYKMSAYYSLYKNTSSRIGVFTKTSALINMEELLRHKV